MWRYTHSNELYHWGVKGMKWGVRKDKKPSYKSTSVSAAIARKRNEKVDKSFNTWKTEAAKRDNAINLGKQANSARIAYQNNKGDKTLKTTYKATNKQYKKALSENTTYRKGVVRQEVGRDAARQYLSEAKKVKKQMLSDPKNKKLQKSYNDLMSKHDVERERARRAKDVGAKRSARIASVKRSMTIGVKTAAATAAVSAGVYAVNKYLQKHNVTVNGKSVNIGRSAVSGVMDLAKKAKNILGYMY